MMRTGSGKSEIGSSQCGALLRALCVAAAAVILASPSTVLAQVFPSGPVRIVVPYAPGAAADAMARLIANGLSAQWPYPVVVFNRPGASTTLGGEMVARAEPDGHTLLFTTDDTFTLIPHQFAKLTFDPMKDLVPVNLSVKAAILIAMNPSTPADSVPALIARARENPGTLNYGSWGTGGGAHLAMETFKSLAKIDILHVPYKGVAPMMTAVVSGEVQLALTGYGTAAGLFETKRIVPLAVASPERVAQLPNTPTMRELGFGEVDATVWWGVAAPAKTPPEIVDQIHAAISRVLNSAETRKVIEARSLVVTDIGPKPFAEQLARESRSRAESVRRFGIKPE